MRLQTPLLQQLQHYPLLLKKKSTEKELKTHKTIKVNLKRRLVRQHRLQHSKKRPTAAVAATAAQPAAKASRTSCSGCSRATRTNPRRRRLRIRPKLRRRSSQRLNRMQNREAVGNRANQSIWGWRMLKRKEMRSLKRRLQRQHQQHRLHHPARYLLVGRGKIDLHFRLPIYTRADLKLCRKSERWRTKKKTPIVLKVRVDRRRRR